MVFQELAAYLSFADGAYKTIYQDEKPRVIDLTPFCLSLLVS